MLLRFLYDCKYPECTHGCDFDPYEFGVWVEKIMVKLAESKRKELEEAADKLSESWENRVMAKWLMERSNTIRDISNRSQDRIDGYS